MSDVAAEVGQLEIATARVFLLTEDSAAPIGKPVREARLVRGVGI